MINIINAKLQASLVAEKHSEAIRHAEALVAWLRSNMVQSNIAIAYESKEENEKEE